MMPSQTKGNFTVKLSLRQERKILKELFVLFYMNISGVYPKTLTFVS